MKSINILLLAITLVAVQACSPKSETDEKAAEAVETPAAEVAPEVTVTPEDRHAAFEKKRVALEEKRKLLQEERIKASMTYTDKEGHLVYNKAEENPSFNGGDRAMKIYLRDNVKFPEDAAKEGLDGTVYVDFVVSSDGHVREVGSTTIPGEEVDQRFVDEAIRVVKSMPRWLPGRQHGKAVDVSYSVPITFEIAS
jgi:TonB family protein